MTEVEGMIFQAFRKDCASSNTGFTSLQRLLTTYCLQGSSLKPSVDESVERERSQSEGGRRGRSENAGRQEKKSRSRSRSERRERRDKSESEKSEEKENRRESDSKHKKKKVRRRRTQAVWFSVWIKMINQNNLRSWTKIGLRFSNN